MGTQVAVSDASFEGCFGACRSQTEGPASLDGRVCLHRNAHHALRHMRSFSAWQLLSQWPGAVELRGCLVEQSKFGLLSVLRAAQELNR